MKGPCLLLLLLLGVLLLAEGVLHAAAKQFHDVMSHGRSSSHVRSHKKLHGWFPDQNQWNEKLYPFWEKGDPRWNNCWRGGKVEARLTSDSPALVGSNVTFAVILQFPRCQKEDNDSNIIYDRNCRNDSSDFPDQYVYNWTKWIDDCGWANCTSNNNHNVFPDGRPFPHHPGWRRKNFVYLFHTLGQYYQKTGGSSALVSINTTNITLGKQMMMVSVYRRGHRTYVPVATASVIYVVTDKIPLYVNLSQKNDRNASDSVFIKDSPITFDVKIHDPSHYLNNSAISYTWGYGDGSGIFISNSPISTHTYTLQGNFSLNLTVQAIIPVPCGPATPTPPLPTSPGATTQNSTSSENKTEWTTPALTTKPPSNLDSPTSAGVMEYIPNAGCNIYRYGHYKTTISIVEGILQVNIIQMTNVQVTVAQGENSLIDFVVTCQGSLPTDACTIVSDPTCQESLGVVCNPVEVTDQCLLTIRRAFNEPGTYCVNITLGDDTSQALTSALISVNGAPGSSSRTVEGFLIASGFLVMFVVVVTLLFYRRYKEYKPIERSAEQAVNREGLSVYFNNVKAVLFPGNNERDPLLKSKPGIV
ncbi:transmembrane glycoprotein NMB isoform X1 [Pelodiscus sinensis]|uniref:transmembrane glycoprotein NMB isoform X1 n=1 Tax=Pelodiscus sinensis TaxID=13735 RepID=UPI003F6D3177